ncbi:ninja-family protein mc410-like [Gastrolobium bilobum]|uniref:ninja-family protein mc410-like n=1 Tax=Gastrolobium bilobum TaxID=150636 RepID=UPI002AAF6CCB|nr:ninja-family protein mc410-like [Gastrolobium bilobum]XP_061343836.1 ninja-family protein mc410-like [Gastrolobium bilobum]XP_061343837.1 ninja-family protein mc410-like [Gastrolobium bilobum]XP_061343838.1 ninja-family protein mc410-like [Gastrolobium bilobum]
MEDEDGLELSLGLSCGGSSVKPKSKNGSSSDTRAEEVGRSGKLVDEFKSIFDAGFQKPDSVGAQTTDSSKPEENFFSDLSKAKGENASLNLNGRGFWVANSNRPVQIGEDKHLEMGSKRKMSFDEINHQKRHGSDVHHADLHDKARTSHTSMTEDGSAAEKEDVADSEADNSTSRPISHLVGGSKQFIRIGVSSDAPKDVRGVADLSATDFNGEKRFMGSSEKDFKHANLTYGASFSVQPVNMMNAPYPSLVKESNSVHAPSPPISGVMHMMPNATSDSSGAQPVSNASLPAMCGYPSAQLPILDGLISHSQQLHPSFAGRGPSNTAAIPVISNNIYEATPYEGRPLEKSKGNAKQRVTEEGSSSQPEVVKGSSTNLRAKDVSDQATGEGSSIDFSVIKPGLGADVKFGGGGSCPNLPWVSATGSASNGRTISGVTYRYSNNQVRIVCACHGSHMTPEEFVQHANEDQAQAGQEGGAVLGTVANGNPAASAHS